MELIYSLFENYGLWILVTVVFIAQMGIPIGSMFFLMWYGSTLENTTTLLMTLPIVTSAAVMGDMSAYFIGRKFSQQLIQAELKYNWIANKTQQSHRLINRYGKWIISLTRFLVTGMGPIVNYLLGSQKYPSRSFLLWVIVGETLFCLELLYFGNRFKESWEDLLSFISDMGWLIALVIISLLLLKKLLSKEKSVATNNI